MPNHSAGRSAAAACAVTALLALGGCNDSTGPSTPAPSITTSSLPDATVGEPYSEAINATGGDGDFSWSLAGGSLPPGLDLSVSDLGSGAALITGTPASAGDFSFRVRVVVGDGRADTASLSITVLNPPAAVAVKNARLPPALAGADYRVILEATGGDGKNFDWRVVEGTLPPGLELTAAGRFQGTVPSTFTDTTVFTVEVRSGGFTSRKQFMLAVAPNDQNAFNITLFPVVDIPPGLRPQVHEATRRWDAAIVGNLAPIAVPADTANGFGPEDCGGFGSLVNGTALDDIIIMVNIDSIDGVGGTLAQAGPCAIRTDTQTPVVGILILDRDDLQGITNDERVTDIIQHEIAHVLGFGSLWDFFDLLEGEGTNDPRYVGERAIDAYRDDGGDESSIPVENEGDEGTVDSHWRNSVFGNELMTGFASPNVAVDMYLSRMTVASFADHGYEVDLSVGEDPPLLDLAPYATPTEDPLGWNDTGWEIIGAGPIIVFNPGSAKP